MDIIQIITKILGVLFEFLYVRPKLSFLLIKDKASYNGKSYYPDMKARPVWKNFLFQLGQIWKHGYQSEFYFMYGFDVKSDKERDEYISYLPFLRRRDYLNYKNNPHNSTCILRNKLYFDIFAKSIGIRTPKIFAYYSQGKLRIWNDGFHNGTFEDLLNIENQELFCKELEGECGAGIFKLNIQNREMSICGKKITPTELEKKIKGTEYIFQEVIIQHPEMSKLYPGSINTMRMVSVRSLKDGEIHIMPSILRIGANGSFVDNTSQGGIAVGFDLTSGQLHEYGFYKPQYGLRTNCHPNSNIKLADFYIPFIQEAENMAILFHSMLKDIHSIGWDIAIGCDGPVFIEGNDNWEINGPQVGNHGLKKEFYEYFYK